MSLVVGKPVFGVSDQVRQNRSVQPQKMTGSRGIYYPFSVNKGADHLRSYCAADLRLCFRICNKPVFS